MRAIRIPGRRNAAPLTTLKNLTSVEHPGPFSRASKTHEREAKALCDSEKTELTTKHYVLVFGLEASEKEMRVVEGVNLVRLEIPLSAFGELNCRTAFPIPKQKPWDLELSRLKCSCELQCDRPFFVASAGREELPTAWGVAVLLLVRGFLRIHCLAWRVNSWSDAPRENIATGRPLDYQPWVFTLPQFETMLTNSHAEWINAKLPVLHRLCQKSPRFLFALKSAYDWRYESDLYAALSKLWSGIESTLHSPNGETVYQLATRASKVLKQTLEDRKEFFREFKRRYGARSSVVHGDPSLNGAKLHEEIELSFGILRDLLSYQIECGTAITQDELHDKVLS